MRIRELYYNLSEKFPGELSCEWDNDGLMCVSHDREIKKVLLSLDATSNAINYASELNCDTLISHHPMIFGAVKRVLPDEFIGNRIVSAVRNNVNIISLHTRLDIADGGVNDALTDRIGLKICGKFGDCEAPEIGRLAEMDEEIQLMEFSSKVKNALGADCIRLTGSSTVKKVAVIGGSGKGFTLPALMSGADTFVTGEIPYNEAEDAAEAGLNIVEAGHFFTENPVLEKIQNLIENICNVKCIIYNSNPQKVI